MLQILKLKDCCKQVYSVLTNNYLKAMLQTLKLNLSTSLVQRIENTNQEVSVTILGSSQGFMGFFLQKNSKQQPEYTQEYNTEFGDLFKLFFYEHVPAVLILINIYSNCYCEVSTLRHTGNQLNLRNLFCQSLRGENDIQIKPVLLVADPI